MQIIPRIREADLMTSVLLGSDARRIVQINDNGQFFVYDVATGRHVVSGRHADGEMIVHDDNGYYAATYEGAYFLNLRFPGEGGLHSFQQFAVRLNRPDVIAAALKDGSAAPPQDLTIPPTAALKARPRGGQISLDITARSSTGLKAIRIYQDGQLTDEVAASGRDTTQAMLI